MILVLVSVKFSDLRVVVRMENGGTRGGRL